MFASFLVRFQKMITLFLSLRSFTLTIFIILLSLCTSNGESENHKHHICSSSLLSCGVLKDVGYPFWGSWRPSYCGHPALHLRCLADEGSGNPVLTVGEQHNEVDYEILRITNTSTIMTIKLRGLFERVCPFNNSNKVFDKIFQFSESVKKINISNVCNIEETEDAHHSFNYCRDNHTPMYYPNKTPSNNQSCNCLEVPVLREELESEVLHQRHEPFDISRILDRGFEVNYLNYSDCFKCQNSQGICGSNDKEFACFHRKSENWKLKIGLGILGFMILVTLNVGIWCFLRRKFYSPILQSSRLPMNSDLEVGTSPHGIKVLPYKELQEATNNFDDANELGDGGLGIVYYGKLKDGREVAVKRLYEKNYKQIEQFMNEIEILTRLRHPNLVTLYGCTSRNSRELLLVYEYIPNGTVADHLFGERKGSKTLSWEIRMKIATGTAHALSYLHASDIIHRDVKTNNILLDNNFSVKVADFGLSRLFPCDVSHVSTVPQGTPGYLDPQYHKNYQVTNKSDVYSFGVVLVELISSLPAVDISRQEDEINLYDYAMNRIQHGVLSELVDQKLGFESDFKVNRMVTLVAELAFCCLQQQKELRPTMDEVLKTLEETESMDYEALKAEDTGQSKSATKPTYMTTENHTEPPMRYTHPGPLHQILLLPAGLAGLLHLTTAAELFPIRKEDYI